MSHVTYHISQIKAKTTEPGPPESAALAAKYAIAQSLATNGSRLLEEGRPPPLVCTVAPALAVPRPSTRLMFPLQISIAIVLLCHQLH